MNLLRITDEVKIIGTLHITKITSSSSRMEMAIEPVAISLLIERAIIAALAAQAEEKGLALHQDRPAELPPVKAAPNKITWVLTNLITNAIRYTEPDGQIEVSAKPAGSFVDIAVSDTGAGIPLEYQTKIFDKFVQVKSDKAVGGSGLGLAICKEIFKAHREL